MLRAAGFGLVAIMVLTGILISSAGNKDKVELVGHGNSSGFGGTDYVASFSENTSGPEAVTSTIQAFFAALNAQDAETFNQLLLDDAGDYWRTLFAQMKPDGWTVRIQEVATPLILGKRCVVDVTIAIGSDVSSGGITEPNTLTMQLLRRDAAWLVADPA